MISNASAESELSSLTLSHKSDSISARRLSRRARGSLHVYSAVQARTAANAPRTDRVRFRHGCGGTAVVMPVPRAGVRVFGHGSRRARAARQRPPLP
jgi:hypothetical protein